MKVFIPIFCSALLSFSCFNSSNFVTLKIINKTNIEVDSLAIEINNYRTRIPIAKPKVMSTIRIYRDSIKIFRRTNIFQVNVIGKNWESFNTGGWANDFGGTVYDSYSITLKDSSILITIEDQ